MQRVVIYFIVLAGILSVAAKGKIELVEFKFLDGRVGLLIPDNFEPMSEEMLVVKYASEARPSDVMTDETGGINVALNLTESRAGQNDLTRYQAYLEGMFKQSYPMAEWIGSGVKEINGRKVGTLELITPAMDTDIYNLLFFTDLDGKLLICTFNCTKKKLRDWQSVGHEIMQSLKIFEQDDTDE